ncbi:hypothetical protein J7K93_10050 [bacterium]|nr:hypothetical protein [bacterium]
MIRERLWNGHIKGLILFILLFCTAVQAQNYISGDTSFKEQVKEYKIILKQHPDSTAVLEKLIQVLIDKKDWGSTEIFAQKLLYKQPENIFAHYAFAVCERELGKNNAPILRLLNFKKSDKYFQKVVEMDSLYKDVFYQWALLKRMNGKYIDAVELIRKQMRIDPQNNIYRYEVFHLIDYMVEDVSSDSIETYLINRKDPYSRYALGELYRRKGVLEAADSVFSSLLKDHGQMELQPVYLSLVRLRITQKKFKDAQRFYWLGVDSVSTNAGAMLVTEGLMFIVHAEEYRALKRYKSFAELKRIVNYLWIKRNLMPAMEYNSRLIEHYRRLLKAEKYYRYDGLRHVLQKSDVANTIVFPPWYYENYKFNDMGLIYIRYGEPDDRITTFGSGVPSNISWLYRQRGNRTKLIFHFYIAPDAPPGYWTLKPMVSSGQELEKLYDWDTKYYRIAESIGADRVKSSDSQTVDDIQAISATTLMSELTDERINDAEFAMKHDEQRFSKTTTVLPMSFIANRFLYSGSNTEVQFAYAIPAGEIFKKAKKDSITLEAGITVFDKYMKEVYKDLQRYKLIKSGKNKHIYKKQFIGKFVFKVYPEKYNIAIHCRIPKTDQLNGSRFKYVVPRPGRNSLSLSTLLLAYDIKFKADSEKRIRGNLNIIPNPSLRFSKKDPLFIYYEVYNLKKGADDLTNYTVTFNIKQKGSPGRKVKNLFGIFGKSESYTITVQNKYSGKSVKDSNFLSFDMSSAGKGEYKLEIVVHDNVSNSEKRQNVEFTLM